MMELHFGQVNVKSKRIYACQQQSERILWQGLTVDHWERSEFFGLWSQFAVLISQITFKPVHTDFEWMVEYTI